MCGGRGTRLDHAGEKPLLTVGGRTMIDRVLDALEASGVETTYAVVSPNAPETREHIAGRIPTVETPGEGYVADLDCALARSEVGHSVLTVAADLPLLSGDAVDVVLEAHGGGSMTVCVPAALKRELGVSIDTAFSHEGRDLAPTGLNVVGGGEGKDRVWTTTDERLAVNVNRTRDAQVAAWFATQRL